MEDIEYDWGPIDDVEEELDYDLDDEWTVPGLCSEMGCESQFVASVSALAAPYDWLTESAPILQFLKSRPHLKVTLLQLNQFKELLWGTLRLKVCLVSMSALSHLSF
jgi:hypothetical protein